MNLLQVATIKKGEGGLHALLVGISDYPYLPGGDKEDKAGTYDLGMKQLATPARSAFRQARWLLKAGDRLPCKLASIRLLIAPSKGERELIRKEDPNIVGAPNHCTLEKLGTALFEWRNDAATNKDNVAWFYFAGHGIQRYQDDSVMLLSGYNRADKAVLGEALDFDHVYRGMEITADFKRMAIQQHFVIDACRTQHDALSKLYKEEVPKPWSWDSKATGKRECATIFGTTTGDASYGSEEGTILGQALLRALEGDAADAEQNNASVRVWTVRNYRLIEVLKILVSEIANKHGLKQTSEEGPKNKNILWSMIEKTPKRAVSITLHPGTAHPAHEILLEPLTPPGAKPIVIGCSRHPYETILESGNYRVSVAFPPGHPYAALATPMPMPLWARPPRADWTIECHPTTPPLP